MPLALLTAAPRAHAQGVLSMKRRLVCAFVLASILPVAPVGDGQTGIACYYDWAAAPRQHFTIADSPEYQAIVAACRQGRADSVSWEQYLQTFQRAADMRALSGEVQSHLLRLVEMLRKEREHLEAVRTARRAIDRSHTPAPAAADSNGRTFDLGPLVDQPVPQPDRLTVAPQFKAWVPQFLRDRIGDIFRVNARIAHFDGEATIRRGDSTARVSALLQRGNTWTLRPGDVFEVQRGRLILEYDGRRYDLRAGGIAALDLDEQCTTQETHRGDRILGAPMYLIEGTLLYTATTARVQPACVVTTPELIVSGRRTAFTMTQAAADERRTVEVVVQSGSVSLEETTTSRAWALEAGQRQGFDFVTPAVLSASVPSRHEWTVENRCSVPIRFRLFEFDAARRRTGSWPEQVIPARSSRQIPIRPTAGRRVCYGAAAGEHLVWGVGIDGSEGCERCCQATTTHLDARTVRLTCQ